MVSGYLFEFSRQIWTFVRKTKTYIWSLIKGDYTCSVQNAHGSDQIVFEIIVQIPPVSPELKIQNLTHTDVELAWRDRRSRKQPILGYTLNYRKTTHGNWETMDVDPLSHSHWLQVCRNQSKIICRFRSIHSDFGLSFSFLSIIDSLGRIWSYLVDFILF